MSKRRADVLLVGVPLGMLLRLALHAPQPFIGVRDLSLQPASVLTITWQATSAVLGESDIY